MKKVDVQIFTEGPLNEEENEFINIQILYIRTVLGIRQSKRAREITIAGAKLLLKEIKKEIIQNI